MIYMLRHGVAERENGVEDFDRRLTEEGERQSRAAGRALAALGVELDACLTSPKVRARDTARLACEALGVGVEEAAELEVGPFDALTLTAGRGDVMLVGHEPSFSNEIAKLSGARADLAKGGLAILDGTTLVALLRPAELTAIAAGGPPEASS